MTRKELRNIVGKRITIYFKDGKEETGVLGYTPEFSEKYGFRKPNYFTINNIDFKVSHIKSVVEYGA